MGRSWSRKEVGLDLEQSQEGQKQGRAGQQLEPSGVGQERKRGRSGSRPGLGQEHSRSGAEAGQEQGRSILSFLFANISPHAIFYEQVEGRSRAGAGQGRSKASGV